MQEIFEIKANAKQGIHRFQDIMLEDVDNKEKRSKEDGNNNSGMRWIDYEQTQAMQGKRINREEKCARILSNALQE